MVVVVAVVVVAAVVAAVVVQVQFLAQPLSRSEPTLGGSPARPAPPRP